MSADAGITLLLQRWTDGDAAAIDQLVPLVYSELKLLARRELRREGPLSTMQTTALVHEAYIRLAGQQSKEWRNRGHFLAVCSQILRQVLVDAARTRQAAKRAHGVKPLPLDERAVPAVETDAGLIALNDGLEDLARVDPLKARIVDLRYFGGFSVDEIGALLRLSTPTVKRHWALAKVWLFQNLDRGEPNVQPINER